MGKKFMDFDKFYKEKKDNITIKIFNNNYVIPSSISAFVALKIAKKMEQNPDMSLETTELFDFLNMIYGKEVIDEWVEKGITVGQLSDILVWTMQQYRGVSEEEDEQVKNEIPMGKE